MEDSRPVDTARIAKELKLKPDQVIQVSKLLDEGNTIPFITRYRKERTGNLDEEQIRAIQQLITVQRQLNERTETILRFIEEQGKLTPELRQAIEKAETLKELEDLYLPYRPKRSSRASQAREKGLGPFAEKVTQAKQPFGDLDKLAQEFVNPEKGLETVQDVLQGVNDIIAEEISENVEVRNRCRRIARTTGKLLAQATKKGKEAGAEFNDYFEFTETLKRIRPHHVLAMNRGEKQGVLRVKCDWDQSRAAIEIPIALRYGSHPYAPFLKHCIDDALERLIHPSLEREIRRELTAEAEEKAITVFQKNLRQLLLQPPVQGKKILAIDPGFRTGCKIAMLDEFGKPLTSDVISILNEQKQHEAKEKIANLLTEHACQLIAIGNGTACRETEEMISSLIEEKLPEVRYLIVNEAGASIYSTSAAGREEFPDLDATERGTISIGRRVQDALSELVKIEPQHIGVGMYQHDISAKSLKESLDQVVESCVNFVGVNLNTASTSLLRHVAGLNQLIARRIVEYRAAHGAFRNRQQLLEVSGIGEATFTQAAGFLRIPDSEEPFDTTSIHPESYEAAAKVLQELGASPTTLKSANGQKAELKQKLTQVKVQELAEKLQIGVPTLKDILDDLARPGRDPRADLPTPKFRQGVLRMEDLKEGMELEGTVLNVLDFGAFVDIGVKNSGLVHISQMSNQFVDDPHNFVAVGDQVTVWVQTVDIPRGRISLSMIPPQNRD